MTYPNLDNLACCFVDEKKVFFFFNYFHFYSVGIFGGEHIIGMGVFLFNQFHIGQLTYRLLGSKTKTYNEL